MSRKVLVADDSLTIQKVVSITLANNGFELTECMNEKDLFSKLASDSFDLILLDFNLSEEKSGYQLSEEIITQAPSTPIMVMLGTFDTVDESTLAQSGIKDKIIKPFESSKFIKKCQELIDNNDFAPTATPSVSEEPEPVVEEPAQEAAFEESEILSDSDIEESIGDQWSVDAPSAEVSQPDPSNDDDGLMPEGNFLEQNQNTQTKNALLDEMEGWGMSVPGVIGSNRDEVTFPPKIGGEVEQTASSNEIESDLMEAEAPSIEEEKVPVEDDLEYPDMGSFDLKTDDSSGFPSLVSMNELNLEDELSPEEPYSIDEPAENATGVEEEVLASEIEADLDPNEFWATDSELSSDEKDSSQPEPIIEQPNIFEAEAPHVSMDIENIEPIENVKHIEPVEEPQKPEVAMSVNEDELVEKIKLALGPIIEEMVKDYCSQKVEQVAWEIIPDLAENLIRTELKEISESVRN